jgi:hypothetical protein
VKGVGREPERIDLLLMQARELVDQGGARVAVLVVVDADGELNVAGTCNENDVIATRALNSIIEAVDSTAKAMPDATYNPAREVVRTTHQRRQKGARS